LLEKVAESSGLRNSKRVRDAASAALQRLKARVEEAGKRAADRRANPSVHENKKKKSGMGTSPNASGAGLQTGAGTRSGAGGAAPSGKTGAGTVAPSSKAAAGSSKSGAGMGTRAPATSGVPRAPEHEPGVSAANDNKAAGFSKSPSTGRMIKPSTGNETTEGDSTPNKRARSQP
jgi:hypothetical protein